ncbi:MAG: RlmE family RNA methyltransferase [Candidatus Thermoplasmatota archaeon]|nr:RlmE family RNA methyltransferase [Candidatus Thermoplasmatota archaeon]
MTNEWIKQRRRDPFYRKAKAEGYRSRAAYKLKEIHDRVHLIKKGYLVLDLGAAPGGWSQVASELVGPGGKVIAVDQRLMEPMKGVVFIQGDIEDKTLVLELKKVGGDFNTVISDISPRLSGNRTLDRGKSFALNWAVMKLVVQVLRPGGGVVLKMFQGEEMNELRDEFGHLFDHFDRFKPKSSLKRSIEIFVAFRGFRGVKEDR